MITSRRQADGTTVITASWQFYSVDRFTGEKIIKPGQRLSQDSAQMCADVFQRQRLLEKDVVSAEVITVNNIVMCKVIKRERD